MDRREFLKSSLAAAACADDQAVLRRITWCLCNRGETLVREELKAALVKETDKRAQEALARIDRFAGEFAPTSQPAAKAVEMRAYYSEAHVRRRAGALDAFLRYTAELDAARGESFRTAFPELAERLDQDQARHRTQHPVPAPSGGIRLAEAG